VVKSTIPKTYKEALTLLRNEKYDIIAGGTDLMVKNKSTSGLLPKFKNNLLFISQLKKLNYIKQRDKYIHIGSTTSLENIMKSNIVHELLIDAISKMASLAIRNTGTLGGNIGNASPAGDTLPILYILDAIIVVENIEGKININVDKFILGPSKIALDSNQLIKEILIEKKQFDYMTFVKVGGRKADAISKLSFTGVCNVKNNIISEFRVAFGAVGPTIIRKKEIERQICGLTIKQIKEKKNWILSTYGQFIKPIDDQRSNAKYRKECSLNLLEDFINNIK